MLILGGTSGIRSEEAEGKRYTRRVHKLGSEQISMAATGFQWRGGGNGLQALQMTRSE
jgi:hypothetical protein